MSQIEISVTVLCIMIIADVEKYGSLTPPVCQYCKAGKQASCSYFDIVGEKPGPESGLDLNPQKN